MLDPSGWVVVPWNRKCYFLLLLLLELGHWFGFSVKIFSKCPISFFSFVLRQALFSFKIQGHIKPGISCSLFVNDVVTMIQFLPELCFSTGNCHPPKCDLPVCHPPCDGTASPPGTAELASLFLVFSVSEILVRSPLSRVGTEEFCSLCSKSVAIWCFLVPLLLGFQAPGEGTLFFLLCFTRDFCNVLVKFFCIMMWLRFF